MTPVTQRVVFDEKYVTAAGVSAGIDMALALAGRIPAGDRTAQAIQLGIEYDPQPPYDAGSPHRAPAEIVAAMRARSRFPHRPAAPADPPPNARAQTSANTPSRRSWSYR